MAYDQIAKGDPTSAGRSAGLAARYALTDTDRSESERLQHFLESVAAAAATTASRPRSNSGPVTAGPVTANVDITAGPPRMVRPDPPAPDSVRAPANPPSVDKPALRTVQGIFAEFICPDAGKTQLRFVIDTGKGKVTLGFARPDAITIRGRDSSKIDLYCGIQDEKLRVTAEYDETTDPGLNGILRVFTFEK
jgi:hypothetical protein